MDVQDILPFKLKDKEVVFAEKCKENLLFWFNQGSEGYLSAECWYTEANKFCKSLVNNLKLASFFECEESKAVEVVAKVIAALSPQNKWETNKGDAKNLISAFVIGGDLTSVKPSTFKSNKRKAIKILEKEPVSWGNKTRAFWQNICLSDKAVTIDLWHLRAVKNGSVDNCFNTLTDRRYKIIEAVTKVLACDHGILGYQFQAVIWVNIRNEWIY